MVMPLRIMGWVGQNVREVRPVMTENEAREPARRAIPQGRRRRYRSILVAGGLVAIAGAVPTTGGVTVAFADPIEASGQPGFGPNVMIFDPSMPTSKIQARTNTVLAQQVSNQFGPQRYAFLFKPGTYGSSTTPLNIQLGYYTSVAGLGLSPDDVTINGTINVYNQCFPPTPPATSNCTALDNFWRSVENLQVSVPPGKTEFWATSQAAPMRRVHVNGNLFLFDYQSSPGYSSGGFIADSKFDNGVVINGSQQQFLTRNREVGFWTNAVWNQVFSGVKGAPAQSFPHPPYTTLPTSPVTREVPFLYIDSSGRYNVFVPALQHDSMGTTWANGPTPGWSIPIGQFFLARPTDSEAKINAALARGKNLIFTPGIYHLDRTIEVKRPGTVLLGLGYPTLIPEDGIVSMKVEGKGSKLAGLLFDAGPTKSPVLLQVGSSDGPNRDISEAERRADAAGPTSLQDVFFRIGGAAPGKATTSLVVNSDNVILDDIWAWRADHGNGVGWKQNTADTGVIVNGDNVTAYGLFVEHYQKYEVIWNGENGRTIFFQNEMPYDPPSQAAWTHAGTNGWAAYKVADSVRHHEAWGLGSYCFFNTGVPIHAARAFEVPKTPGVLFHDLLTVFLNGSGGIDHVINDTGAPVPVNGKAGVPSDVVSYP
jgi:hypothetical protein